MYKQLTLEQRHYIYMTRKKGQSMRSIAAKLGMSHSTVSRELKRNAGKRGYRYQQANNLAQQRHALKNKSVKMNQVLKRLIKNCLALDWSPEQICGWLKANHIINLHHESVYRYLLKDKAEGGLLHKQLRHQGRPYRKHYGYANNRTGIPDRVDIEKRSEAVNNREVFGHWEANTMIDKAHQGAIVTIDERISKLRPA